DTLVIEFGDSEKEITTYSIDTSNCVLGTDEASIINQPQNGIQMLGSAQCGILNVNDIDSMILHMYQDKKVERVRELCMLISGLTVMELEVAKTVKDRNAASLQVIQAYENFIVQTIGSQDQG
ncbi:hypothetical protein HAX54_018008, partial [Datura stramonium]|nr:hypothetical protein [Datura stramonium]